MNVVKISSLDLPFLEPYRTMRRTMEHRKEGIFVAEGEKVVRRLVESNLTILSMLMTEEWFGIYSGILEGRQIEQCVFVAGKSLLEQIVGFGLHQGIMAIGRVPEAIDVFARFKDLPEPRLLLATDGIANSENMGVIARNCAAFGVQVLLTSGTSCDPYLRRSVRNSMGTIFKLSTASVDDLAETFRKLRDEYSFRIIAADPNEDSIEIVNADLTKSICLVFGSEGTGISHDVLEECEVRVKIPMSNNVDSINVATSVGVALFEVSRQRTADRVRS